MLFPSFSLTKTHFSPTKTKKKLNSDMQAGGLETFRQFFSTFEQNQRSPNCSFEHGKVEMKNYLDVI
jgi:hypothetical protein